VNRNIISLCSSLFGHRHIPKSNLIPHHTPTNHITLETSTAAPFHPTVLCLSKKQICKEGRFEKESLVTTTILLLLLLFILLLPLLVQIMISQRSFLRHGGGGGGSRVSALLLLLLLVLVTMVHNVSAELLTFCPPGENALVNTEVEGSTPPSGACSGAYKWIQQKMLPACLAAGRQGGKNKRVSQYDLLTIQDVQNFITAYFEELGLDSEDDTLDEEEEEDEEDGNDETPEPEQPEVVVTSSPSPTLLPTETTVTTSSPTLTPTTSSPTLAPTVKPTRAPVRRRRPNNRRRWNQRPTADAGDIESGRRRRHRQLHQHRLELQTVYDQSNEDRPDSSSSSSSSSRSLRTVPDCFRNYEMCKVPRPPVACCTLCPKNCYTSQSTKRRNRHRQLDEDEDESESDDDEEEEEEDSEESYSDDTVPDAAAAAAAATTVTRTLSTTPVTSAMWQEYATEAKLTLDMYLSYVDGLCSTMFQLHGTETGCFGAEPSTLQCTSYFVV
jgi:hypothetical protein